MHSKKPLKETLSLVLLKILSLFPLQINRKIGAAMGYLAWKFSKKQRHFAHTNIQHCLPSLNTSQQQTLLKESFIESGKLLTELAIIWLKPREERKKIPLEVEGMEILEAAHEKGHGVLMLTPHLGNWEVFPQFILEDYPFSAMFRPPRMKALNDVIKTNREKDGAKLFPITAGGIKNLIKEMNKGAVTVILPDQEPDSRGGIFSQFFNQDAWTMTLAPKLFQKTQVALVMGCVLRTEKGFKCIIKPIADAQRTDSLDVLTLKFNQAIEELIQLQPSQYAWSYKRFYTQPDGRPQIYL